MKTYIGIDVGKNGGIACIDEKGKVMSLQVTPMIGKGKGSQLNLKEIKKLLTSLSNNDNSNILVGIEDVHSIYGSSAGSNFTFGNIAGLIRGLIDGLDIPYQLIAPKIWQAECFKGVPVIRKPGSKAKGAKANDTKAMALVAVQRLYPKEDFRASQRCTNPHDGIVDALLIAHFIKTKY